MYNYPILRNVCLNNYGYCYIATFTPFKLRCAN